MERGSWYLFLFLIFFADNWTHLIMFLCLETSVFTDPWGQWLHLFFFFKAVHPELALCQCQACSRYSINTVEWMNEIKYSNVTSISESINWCLQFIARFQSYLKNVYVIMVSCKRFRVRKSRLCDLWVYFFLIFKGK